MSTIWVKCDNCNGKGLVEFKHQKTIYVTCPDCGGRGSVEVADGHEEWCTKIEQFTSTDDNTTLPFEPTEAEQADEEDQDEETMQLEAETVACEEIEAGGDALMEWPAPETIANPLACPNEGCDFIAKTPGGLKVHINHAH